VQNINEMM